MHASPKLGFHLVQLRLHPFADRLPQHRKSSIAPLLYADMCKAKKVERLRFPFSTPLPAYNQRAGAENLIKEANNDAGLAAHPSRRWDMNCVHFQLAMLAYNLNCWLMLFQREEKAKAEELQHTTLAISCLRFLFLAAKIWRHAGRVGISYSDQYAERGLFQRLMDRLPKYHSESGEISAGAGQCFTILSCA
jgi:hypothetical protein